MARKISNFWLYIRDSKWLNFIHFLGYKYKIRFVSILRKREDQAFISISTILKFTAQNKEIELLQQSLIFLSHYLRNPMSQVGDISLYDFR